MPDKKKRIMHKFRLDEISTVDNPAQAGAKAVILKRDDPKVLAKAMFDEVLAGMEIDEKVRDAMDDMWKLNSALRTSIYSIVGDKDEYPDTLKAVKESVSQFVSAVSSIFEDAVDGSMDDEAAKAETPKKSEGGKMFPASDYAYVPDRTKPSTWKLRLTSTPGGEPDPRIVGAAAAALGPGFRGNKVSIPSGDRAAVVARVRRAWLKANPSKSREDLPQVLKSDKEDSMPEPKAPTVEELTKSLEELNKQLLVAKAYGELNDAEKTHYAKLSDEDKDTFLALDSDKRSAEVSKAADADPVVYTTSEGLEIRKSDGNLVLQLAKKSDENEKKANALAKAAEQSTLEKRVREEIPNVPGEDDAKVALLKAVDGISDKDMREKVHTILKSHNETIGLALETHGERDGEIQKAEDELKKKVTEFQKENKIPTYEQAYTDFLATEEGAALYAKTVEQ